MAQVSKFGHLLLHSSLPKPSNSNIQFRSLLTLLASSSKRHRSIPPFRRKSTTPKPMEVKEESSSFNKRRAQGRDKNDISQKNLYLKVRKLNPINTISFVQVPFTLLSFSIPLSITNTNQTHLLFLLITNKFVFFRYWELAWILKILLRQSCFSSTIKDLYSMLGR